MTFKSLVRPTYQKNKLTNGNKWALNTVLWSKSIPHWIKFQTIIWQAKSNDKSQQRKTFLSGGHAYCSKLLIWPKQFYFIHEMVTFFFQMLKFFSVVNSWPITVRGFRDWLEGTRNVVFDYLWSAVYIPNRYRPSGYSIQIN